MKMVCLFLMLDNENADAHSFHFLVINLSLPFDIHKTHANFKTWTTFCAKQTSWIEFLFRIKIDQLNSFRSIKLESIFFSSHERRPLDPLSIHAILSIKQMWHLIQQFKRETIFIELMNVWPFFIILTDLGELQLFHDRCPAKRSCVYTIRTTFPVLSSKCMIPNRTICNSEKMNTQSFFISMHWTS